MKRTARFSFLLSVSCALVVGVSWLAFPNSYLLYEDFNDGVANGFYEVGGTWSVADGRYTQSSTACPPRSWANAIGNYVIQVECTPLSGLETKVIYAHADTSEDYRVDFWLDRSRLSVPAWGESWSTRNFTVYGLNLAYNHSYSVKIEVGWTGVKVWVNDVLQHDQPWVNDWPLGDGNIGFGTNAASSRFDDLIVSVPLVGLRTVFIEDFNDGVANGFTEVSGSWSVISGKYVQLTVTPGGPYRTWVDSLSRCLSEDLSAYVVEVDCTPHSGQETKVIYAHADSSEDYRVDFWLDGFRLSIPAWGQAWDTRNVTLNGLSLSYSQTYHVMIEVSWAGVKVWVNGALQHDEPWRDDIPLGDGRVGVGTCVASSSFDNVIVRAATGPTGRVWYVDDSAGWSGDGTSWAKAFDTIQEGIDAAANGDFVLVAVGTYWEDIHFQDKNIALRGTDPLDDGLSYNTIIRGSGKNPTVTFTGTENESCLISGLTIAYGQSKFGGGICGGTTSRHARAYLRHVGVGSNAAGNSGGGIAFFDGPILNSNIGSNWTTGEFPQGNGGGLYQCHGPIRNSWIGKNEAGNSGGGLYQCNGIIEYSTIEENSAVGDGGGLYDCDGPIRNNTISENSALFGGGAANCDGTIQYNTISENTCTWLGGGLYTCNGRITDNTINSNEACRGGGLALCDYRILNNVISGNQAISRSSSDPGRGGGLYECDYIIENNTIVLNIADHHGGGGLSHCDGAIMRNLIAGNTGDYGSGGLYYCDATILSNVIAGNSGQGGGLGWCDGPILNNTIVGNSGEYGSAGGVHGCLGTIQNCIIWGNTSAVLPGQVSSGTPVTYCCIQDWTGGGQGNTDANPKFVDWDGPDNDPATYLDNNYRLVDGSKCIDSGYTEMWMWSDVDLDGNPRVFFGGTSLTVDMGAYEYGSFPFRIVKIEKMPPGENRLTWTSRSQEKYTVWSCKGLPTLSWHEEETVVSQGEFTVWSDKETGLSRKFYRIELLY